jgi:DNA-binding NarL/FixJ family response regulator
MVRSALHQHPHFEVVGEAENGAQAIEEVKRVKPDVVVLNVTMPLVNGFEAAREIRRKIPETAIVILSCMQTNILSRKPGRLVCEPMSRNRRSAKPSSVLWKLR